MINQVYHGTKKKGMLRRIIKRINMNENMSFITFAETENLPIII